MTKENIFSNFYSKVLNFFTTNKEEGESARDSASNRLKLVLMQDRSNLDGATMQKMRGQLIAVISKYIEIDTEALDLNLEGDGDEIALMLNIPVIRARTPEEIAEIEAKEEAEMEQAEEEQESSEDEIDGEEKEEDSNEDSEEENNETEDTIESESDKNVEDEEPKTEENPNESTEVIDEDEIEINDEDQISQKTKKQRKNKNN